MISAVHVAKENAPVYISFVFCSETFNLQLVFENLIYLFTFCRIISSKYSNLNSFESTDSKVETSQVSQQYFKTI